MQKFAVKGDLELILFEKFSDGALRSDIKNIRRASKDNLFWGGLKITSFQRESVLFQEC